MTEPVAPPVDTDDPPVIADPPARDDPPVMTDAPVRDDSAVRDDRQPIVVPRVHLLGSFKPGQVAFMAGQMLRDFNRGNTLSRKILKGGLIFAGVAVVLLFTTPLGLSPALATLGMVAGPYSVIALERNKERKIEARNAAIQASYARTRPAEAVEADVLPDMGPAVPGPAVDTPDPTGPEASVPDPVAPDPVTPDPVVTPPGVDPVGTADPVVDPVATPDPVSADPEPEIVDAELVEEPVVEPVAAELPIIDIPESDIVEVVGTPVSDLPNPASSVLANRPVAAIEAGPSAAVVGDPAAAYKFKGRDVTAEQLHELRSEVAKTRFWGVQGDQAEMYRDQLSKIAGADTAAKARSLATEVLLVGSKDAPRCRENLAYRSAFEQIVDTSKGAGGLDRVRTFAAEVLGIYTPDVSAATNRRGPTMEQNAQVAARAGAIGTVAVTIPAVARIVADAARTAAGPRAASGATLN